MKTQQLARNINELRIGDYVKAFHVNTAIGRVADKDGAIVRVNWPNGDWSYFHVSDGFRYFEPIAVAD